MHYIEGVSMFIKGKKGKKEKKKRYLHEKKKTHRRNAYVS